MKYTKAAAVVAGSLMALGAGSSAFAGDAHGKTPAASVKTGKAAADTHSKAPAASVKTGKAAKGAKGAKTAKTGKAAAGTHAKAPAASARTGKGKLLELQEQPADNLQIPLEKPVNALLGKVAENMDARRGAEIAQAAAYDSARRITEGQQEMAAPPAQKQRPAKEQELPKHIMVGGIPLSAVTEPLSGN